MDYASLQTSIAAWVNRDDLTALIPEFIANAEARFNRTLRVPSMETVTTLTATSGTVSLPSDFLEMRSVYLDASPDVALEPMGLADLRAYYAATTSGTPANFAIQGSTQLVLGPAPSASCSLVLNYYAAIPALATATTNWLIVSHSDLYRAAAMAEAYAYTRDDDAHDRWLVTTNTMLAELASQGRKKATGGPLRMRPNTFA